jgi:CCR4-NOT transcription complex subunit 7/8
MMFSEDPSSTIIRNVWSDNLDQEIATIRQIITKYPYVAMDTEFPGVVARPIGNFKTPIESQYQTLRCNVDLLNIIQLGLTFADESGNFPPGASTWQFHFKFSLSDDMYAQESIDLLSRSGLDFKRHELYGISQQEFGYLLTASGLVMNPSVKWISFHSGYDFGYLLKVLTMDFLPNAEGDFFDILYIHFPNIYDIKYLMKSCRNLKGGLQDVADELNVPRIGPQHQAGSDSLLTMSTFFQLRKIFFDDKIEDEKFAGQLYGLTSYSYASYQQHYPYYTSQQNHTPSSFGTPNSANLILGGSPSLLSTANTLRVGSLTEDAVVPNTLGSATEDVNLLEGSLGEGLLNRSPSHPSPL